MKSKCDDCESSDLAASEVASSGVYGPDLLPGTGWFGHAKFQVQVCLRCGRTYWWVRSQDLDKVRKSGKFTRSRQEDLQTR